MKKHLFKILLLAVLFTVPKINGTNSFFSSGLVLSSNTFSTGYWAKPSIPTNLHWDNPDVSCDGSTNSQNITADWDNSIDDVAIAKYEYEVIYPTNIGGTGIWNTFITTSQYTGVFNQAEGLYTFRIRAYDADDNISDWSNSCSIAYDKTIPSSIITQPMLNLKQDNDIYTVRKVINFWNKEIKGTASDDSSGVDKVELSILHYKLDLFGRQINENYWNGSSWNIGTESTVRVGATGTIGWNYIINDSSLPYGLYKIVSHAIDNAGNIENSATIEFKYIPTSVETITPIPTPTTNINISSDDLSNKINLNVTNILVPVDYEILYTGNGIEKGIFGHINSDEIVDSKYSKDFYFGTCSAGGNCTPETIETGSIITVNLTNGVNLTKTFNY